MTLTVIFYVAVVSGSAAALLLIWLIFWWALIDRHLPADTKVVNELPGPGPSVDMTMPRGNANARAGDLPGRTWDSLRRADPFPAGQPDRELPPGERGTGWHLPAGSISTVSGNLHQMVIDYCHEHHIDPAEIRQMAGVS